MTRLLRPTLSSSTSRLVWNITFPEARGGGRFRQTPQCLNGREQPDRRSENDECPINSDGGPSLGAGLQVEHCWVDEAEWNTVRQLSVLDQRLSTAYHANAPMSETNLSSSLELAHESREQKMTVPARNKFFCHLTLRLFLPDRTNRPFSMIRTAGKSCRGIESRMAIESKESALLKQ